MPKPLPSDSLEAAIRAHFGLTQQELARHLGISRTLLTHLETGRRQATLAVSQRLHWLADLLPAPEGHGPVAPDFALPPLPATNADALLAALPDFGLLPTAILRKRQRQAGAQAAAIRWTLQHQGKQTRLQQRRQWGLSVLQQATHPVLRTANDQRRFEHWLYSLAADVTAAAPTPAVAAERALAVLRLLVLDAEVAGLARLLGAATRL